MSEKRFRILLVSPISEYKDYILHDWIHYIKSLERSYNSGIVSLDIMLCDNSQNSIYHKQISRRYNVPIIHVNPFGKNSRQFICESRNTLADYFLRRDYTHFLSLECDLFPHENFLTELLAFDKKIISFPYFIGDGSQSEPMLNVVDHSREDPCSTRNITVEEMFGMAGKIIPVFNPGLGCTLIRRSIIEMIDFRWDEDIEYHDDSFFADDLFFRGIKWYCSFTNAIRHLNQPWNYFPEAKF